MQGLNRGDGTLPVVDVLLHKLCPLSEKERDEAAELITGLVEAAEEAFECLAGELNPRRNSGAMQRLDAVLAKARSESGQ